MSERHGAGHGLTDHELSEIRMLIEERTGIHFDESRERFLSTRVREHMHERGYTRATELLRAVRKTNVEYDSLLERMLTQETSFFRYPAVFEAFEKRVLPEIHVSKFWKNPRTLRVWSAGCSTGEEPYSIAIWLMENWSLVDTYNIEIVGSDIDTRALQAAAEGVYGERALARLSRDVIERYFQRVAGDEYRIDPGLRNSIEFTRANLIDATDMARYRDFDIVFCRNVLIYFDDASRRLAAENLYDCLRPGGYICLGHSETMSRISPLFDVCRFSEAIIYQRPEADHG